MSTVTTSTAARRVVAVGVDASTQALAAARYAADFADREKWDLWLVCAYQAPSVPAEVFRTFLHASRAEALASLQTLLTKVRIAPHVRLRTMVQQGPATATLTNVSKEVQLLVLGQHHLELDGSHQRNHASTVISGASCPVTIVPASWEKGRTALRPVFLALDGLTDAHQALALAFDDAASRHASVVALHATPGPQDQTANAEMMADLAEILAGARQDFPDVPVRTMMLEDAVAPAIIEQSASASVVILGRPHHHHLGSWHWSVARGVLDEASCPVTVVATELVSGHKSPATLL